MSMFGRLRTVWRAAPDESGSGGGASDQPTDSRGFEALVLPLLPGWIQLARRAVGELAEAEEIVFQALGKLWQRLRGAPASVDDLPSYGARAVMNEARDHLRRRRRRARRDAVASANVLNEEPPASVTDPLSEMLAREAREALNLVIEGLEEEDRLVVHLHVFCALPLAEVARRITAKAGSPRNEEWAKKRFQRAMQKLREAALRLLGERKT